MNLKEVISNNLDLFFAGILALCLLLLILLISCMVRLHKLNGKYKKFMTGSNGANLESRILARFAEIDGLKTDAKQLHEELDAVKENLMITYQKVGVVKYDAFKEMGGKLSFVLALLDKNNNGILLNSVHSSREGCYTYLKEIIKGESFLELSEDEREALEQAKNSGKYME
jgi:hypothetical protein